MAKGGIVKEFEKGRLVERESEYALWNLEGLGPVLALKRDLYPDRCGECGHEPEDCDYNIEFHLSSMLFDGTAAMVTVSFKEEEKRDREFDKLDIVKIWKMIMDLKNDLGKE